MSRVRPYDLIALSYRGLTVVQSDPMEFDEAARAIERLEGMIARENARAGGRIWRVFRTRFTSEMSEVPIKWISELGPEPATPAPAPAVGAERELLYKLVRQLDEKDTHALFRNFEKHPDVAHHIAALMMQIADEPMRTIAAQVAAQWMLRRKVPT